MDIIPIPAWEQAVILCLFVVAVFVFAKILRGFLSDIRSDRLKIAQAQRESTSEMSKVQSDATAAMFDKLTNFIDTRDKQWQAWLDRNSVIQQSCVEQNTNRVDRALADMSRAVQQVAEAVGTLNNDFKIHVAEETAMLDSMLDAQQKLRVEEKRKSSSSVKRSQE